MCSPVLSTVQMLHNTAAEVLANLINADKRLKEIQIGNDEIKTVNFFDNTTIFLSDITCLNRIQATLKIYKKDKIIQR